MEVGLWREQLPRRMTKKSEDWGIKSRRIVKRLVASLSALRMIDATSLTRRSSLATDYCVQSVPRLREMNVWVRGFPVLALILGLLSKGTWWLLFYDPYQTRAIYSNA
jgi:hypothetical protein